MSETPVFTDNGDTSGNRAFEIAGFDQTPETLILTPFTLGMFGMGPTKVMKVPTASRTEGSAEFSIELFPGSTTEALAPTTEAIDEGYLESQFEEVEPISV